MIKTQLGPVQVDPARLRAFTRAGGGPVVNDMMRRGTNVQTRAKQLVRKRTRKTERSIVKRLAIEPRGVVVYVVTDVETAVYEHDGTRPHIIRPRNRKALRFPASGSRPGGVAVVFAKQVRHPGTTGSRFLVLALPAAKD